MKKRKLYISITTLHKSLQETLRACKRAEQGLSPLGPIEQLHFADHATLFKMLSSKRWELVTYLRKNGPLSTRGLAKHLSRDYKNVYQDIKLLQRLGLIAINKEKKFIVPWDDITIELALAA